MLQNSPENPAQEHVLACRWLGRMPYGQALTLQQSRQESRIREECPDTLFLLEHPPTYTTGKRTDAADFLIPREILQDRGFRIHDTGRGGQITYHGPGQLIMYFIIHLYRAQKELRRFVGDVEETVCTWLKERWNVESRTEEAYPGIWVGDRKIAALGISVNHQVTMHGTAINLNTDLSAFRNIVPCGIRDRDVCSLQDLTGQEADMPAAARELAETFARIRGYGSLVWEG